MLENLLKSVKLTIAAIIIFSGFYSLILLTAATFMSPAEGKVELCGDSDGKTAAVLVGQAFTEPKYFWGRPSAVNYDASSSAGSNKGPTNPEYLETVSQRIDSFLVKNPKVRREQITSELVTASGSGLDPHITRSSAMIQIPRIAEERGLPESQLENLVKSNIEAPVFGVLGTERINLNKLNLELDELR